ncbi:MAG: MATE family efflux transporter [Methanomassiliicoccaceae archaeon]|nr:MATE family efflux transporter [Methanomassiliicoccaceae archaeon]
MTDEGPMTKDVEIMLGSPKKAVIKMAGPITVAIFASSINGLIDAAWISGLGPNALSAIGLLFPLFFITVGVSSGISVGASAAIARHIGAGSKDNAERTASAALTLSVVTALIFSVSMLIIARPLMMVIGGADVIDECMDYANVLFIFATAFFINTLMSSFLRSEGSARRSMIVMVTSALLNLVLDPIFIYSSDGIFGFGLGLGMAGAALATAVSIIISTIPAFYWFFVKKDTYIRLRVGRPHFDRAISKDIFRVGIPASVEYVAISVAVLIMNMILVTTALGTETVAIYSSGWRIFNIVMIPSLAIGAAVVPICAAAYGGRDVVKAKQAFMYSLRISTITMTALAVLLYIGADIMSRMFTYTDDMEHLHGEITQFIRISCIFLPFVGFGIMSSSLFQSFGMGTKALISTTFRNFVSIPVAFVISLNGTLVDIWWGTAFMEIIGPAVVLVWCLLILRMLVRREAPGPART